MIGDINNLGLTTKQLIEQIEETFNLVIDRNTITAWTRREDLPMPVAYKGKAGQGHRYDWASVRPWLEVEIARTSSADAQNIDDMDWAMARTVKERERAKQAQLDTLSRAGAIGFVREMELEAEDLGRQAVEMLLVLPDRLAPQLAIASNEVQCFDLLDRELREICNKIADLGMHSTSSTA